MEFCNIKSPKDAKIIIEAFNSMDLKKLRKELYRTKVVSCDSCGMYSDSDILKWVSYAIKKKLI